MLKMIHGNKFFTVFLLSAITIMITVAFVFWGIGPADNPTVSFVALIEDEKISLDQYWRAYDNEYKRLRNEEKSPEDIEKLNLEDRVLATLVDRIVLRVAAQQTGIRVTEKELQKEIMKTEYFQKDGAFNKDIYERALKLNRLSPRNFESSIRNDILISKMSNLIGETAELSSDELKILDSMQEENKDQLRTIFRSSKSNQTVQAYIESIKRQLDIQINRDLIS